ncbi:MAG TPA: transglutaminase family protein, partial [Verrucomicrobiae bacterium]|nr:transglutaminase family protein [Verrucomicrobiae bacterium]
GDHLENFLFEKKRGNCEFCASSLGVLLRLAGVPSRLVGGYLGGDYNEAGGYYRVTQDMAHVWVEAYVEGRGWLRVDPTEWGTDAGSRRRTGLLKQARMYLDTLDYYWTAAVVTYDLESQLNLVRRAGSTLKVPRLALEGRAFLPAAAFATLLLLYALRRRQDADARLLAEFRRIVPRLSGSPWSEGTALREAAAATGSPRAVRFADIFGGAAYRDRRLREEERRELEGLLRELREELRSRKGESPKIAGIPRL